MLDIGWSELLVIGVVALIVVGPKDLPVLLRTIGKYVGMIKRQAGEFRAQFDEAIRESELDQLKHDMNKLKAEAEGTLRETEQSVTSEFQTARASLDDATTGAASAAAAASTGASSPEVGTEHPTPPAAIAAQAAESPAAPVAAAGAHDGAGNMASVHVNGSGQPVDQAPKTGV